MAQQFLILVPRRRSDPTPEKLLLENLAAYGEITRTADWVSLFNYASIKTYDAIFISCSAYADEYQKWQREIKRLHPHQVIILYVSSSSFKVGLIPGASRIFAWMSLEDGEKSVPATMSRLEKYQKFKDSLGSKVSKGLLRANGFGDFIGNSSEMLNVYRQITRVASSEYTVLVQGESGSGKELVARTLHRLSPRAGKPFVSINCAAIPENLLESELFGFEKGAFTGANQAKAGKFELANGGTLFLDEIGDMPIGLQVKLLRVLEDRKIQPLGSVHEKDIDIRLVTATHRNLDDEIQAGAFREDLHYRLNVIPLQLPALRERSSDLPLLLMHFLGKLIRGEDQSIEQVNWDVISALESYTFSGNVRELENILTRCVIGTDGDLLTLDSLPSQTSTQSESQGVENEARTTDPELQPLWKVERDHLALALVELEGNISRISQQLEISRTAIYRKIKKYDLTLDEKDKGEEGSNA